MAAKKKTINFESSLQQLETLVAQMENGNLSLEESLKAFETGIGLTRECQTMLDQAEQKVQLLSEQHGKLSTQPFNIDSDLQ